ncbi:MAG: rhomboid family intramembrane serine protease [Lutibacter sp.]
MSENQLDKKTNHFILIPILFIISIWAVYIFEIYSGFNFNKYGIEPRTFRGLRGILFSPFIHANTSHLINNSIPLAVLLGSLLFFYRKIAFKVLILGWFLSGLLTWIIARYSFHIGASGIIYFLVSFIFFSGVIRKYYRLIALSLAVVFLYGGLVWYILPIDEKISWEGHLSGFLIGLVLAIIFRKQGPQQEPFIFSKNETFEKQFDENGNFIEQSDEDIQTETE